MRQNPREKRKEIFTLKQEGTTIFVMAEQNEGVISKNLKPVEVAVSPTSGFVGK